MTSTVFTAAEASDEFNRGARRLRDVLEPTASMVYFAPEVHAAFQEIGFGPGVSEPGSVMLPDLAAYYCSRAGAMGRVPGPVVVTAFGVFAPDLVIAEVERGWATASRADILAARDRGVDAFLSRVLGDPPERERATDLLARAAAGGWEVGRPLFAGPRSLPRATTPWGALWRAANLVREYRGDSHIAAWNAAGLDPVEAGLLTEIYYGFPRGRYHATRGWPLAALDAGVEPLRSRGLVTGDPTEFTADGSVLREGIELATDRQMAPLLGALAPGELEELSGILERWAGPIVAAGGFPAAITQIPASWGTSGGRSVVRLVHDQPGGDVDVLAGDRRRAR